MKPAGDDVPGLSQRWRKAFLDTIRVHENAGPLKAAALTGRLREWTRLLTAVVVRSCADVGWQAAAKGHTLDLLSQAGQEFLGMDVMAFESSKGGDPTWRFPVAVFELENSRDDDRVAYSLWKVLCLRTRLRVVFAYRGDWDEAGTLTARLSAEVVGPVPLIQRSQLTGETLFVVGSRGEADTFPWSYFKVWELDPDRGTFERV